MENNKLTEALERVIASLTDEQKEKAKACETLDQLTSLLGELGVELPDEFLDDVGGGFNLGSYFNRPLFTPLFGGGFGSGSSSGGVDATHLDIKGTPSVTAVHTDVSAASKKPGKTQYV